MNAKEANSAGRTVAQKMGIKHGSRAHLIGTSEAVVASMQLPSLVEAPELDGEFD